MLGCYNKSPHCACSNHNLKGNLRHSGERGHFRGGGGEFCWCLGEFLGGIMGSAEIVLGWSIAPVSSKSCRVNGLCED